MCICIQETSQLCVSLRDLGIGLPHHTQQVAIRVESSVLHGTEPLASAAVGWLQVSKRLNAAHYRALKATLGIEGVSLGSGGYARVLCALGIDLHLATKVALRILSARARLLMVPSHSAIPGILEGARRVPGATWLDDSLPLERRFGISEDFIEFAQHVTPTISITVSLRCAFGYGRLYFPNSCNLIATGLHRRRKIYFLGCVMLLWRRKSWRYLHRPTGVNVSGFILELGTSPAFPGKFPLECLATKALTWISAALTVITHLLWPICSIGARPWSPTLCAGSGGLNRCLSWSLCIRRSSTLVAVLLRFMRL